LRHSGAVALVEIPQKSSDIVSARRSVPMTISLVVLQPLIALIGGILILLMPRLLNYIVAVYLIIIGITGLWPHLLR
jgi:hypothetical protein